MNDLSGHRRVLGASGDVLRMQGRSEARLPRPARMHAAGVRCQDRPSGRLLLPGAL